MNISKIHDCFGCGICAVACNRELITIRLSADEFYEPHLTDATLCTDCGACAEVCSFLHKDLVADFKPVSSYGAWSNNRLVRRKCSSGGVAFELGRYLITQGYKVCGVRYNAEKGRAEHYIATTVEELIQSIGSKYIQSYTVDGFKAIDNQQRYLVVGTPCQIDSFRRFIRKTKREDHFVLMDFFCHGVPSLLAWQRYCEWAEHKVGKITNASWRNKLTGWHDSWCISLRGNRKERRETDLPTSYNMLIRGTEGTLNSRMSQGDMFYKLFLGHYCMNKACVKKCKYKYNHSSADIRVGDFWGKTYNKDKNGVSAVVAFTDKGAAILQRSDSTLVPYSFEQTAEGQMKENCKSKAIRSWVIKILRNMTAEKCWTTLRLLLIVYGAITFPNTLASKIGRTIFKIKPL